MSFVQEGADAGDGRLAIRRIGNLADEAGADDDAVGDLPHR